MVFDRGNIVAAGVRVLLLVRHFHVLVVVFRVLRPGFTVSFFLGLFVHFFHVFFLLFSLALFVSFFLVLFAFFLQFVILPLLVFFFLFVLFFLVFFFVVVFFLILFVFWGESLKYFCFRHFPCDLVISTFSRR